MTERRSLPFESGRAHLPRNRTASPRCSGGMTITLVTPMRSLSSLLNHAGSVSRSGWPEKDNTRDSPVGHELNSECRPALTSRMAFLPARSEALEFVDCPDQAVSVLSLASLGGGEQFDDGCERADRCVGGRDSLGDAYAAEIGQWHHIASEPTRGRALFLCGSGREHTQCGGEVGMSGKQLGVVGALLRRGAAGLGRPRQPMTSLGNWQTPCRGPRSCEQSAETRCRMGKHLTGGD